METKLVIGGLSVDDRGSVSFVNNFDPKELGIRRQYIVRNHQQNYIRAWHGHNKESKYVMAISGTALIGTVNFETEKIEKFILSSEKPSILYIPNGFANGFKTLTENSILMFFSTSTLEESLGDDIRYPYDKWNIWEPDYR